MRFMMMIMSDERVGAGRPPDPELIAAIGKLTEEMIRAGVVLETGGLLPTATGARLRLAGGEVTVTDGPFTEAKEVIGGYAIIRASSRAEAIELGKRFLAVHGAAGRSAETQMEIRQIADVSPERAPDID